MRFPRCSSSPSDVTSSFPAVRRPRPACARASTSPDFSVTRVGDTDETAVPVLTSTVRSASAFAVYSRSFGLNIEKSSAPASTRVTRASSSATLR